MDTPLLPTMVNSSAPETSLEDLNDARAEELVPAMVVLGLFMLVGTVGNLLVCYVFGFKFTHTVQHLLVVSLAVFDLLSCLFSIPADIVDMRYFYKFPSEPACKISRFITAFSSIGSILTLIVIALDRYRKICKPTQRQMEVNHLKVCLGVVFLGTIFFSWPTTVIYGMRSIDAGIPGLDAKDCSTSDKIKDTVFPMLFISILFLVFIFLCATLIIVYCKILMVIKRHSRSTLAVCKKFPTPPLSKRSTRRRLSHDMTSDETNDEDFGTGQDRENPTSSPAASDQGREPRTMTIIAQTGDGSVENHTHFTEDADSLSTEITSHGHHSGRELHMVHGMDSAIHQLTHYIGEKDHRNSQGITLTRFTPKLHHFKNSDDAIILKFTENEKDIPESFTEQETEATDNESKTKRQSKENTSSKSNQRGRKHSLQNSKFERKTTIIAFLVTMVFILSFLPYLCLQVSKQIDEGFDARLEGAALVAFNIFLRSYYINSISNSFIYGALNIQFRHEVRALFSNLFKKCTRCRIRTN